MELKDSGNRREFETGAVRDIAEGKGRCDLLPLDVVADLYKDNQSARIILLQIEQFKKTKLVGRLREALLQFAASNYDGSISTMMLEVSIHYEAGAKKYSENNWKKGLPLHSPIASGVSHFLKYLRGDTDEPHDRAFVWNMLCAIWTYENKPELDDIEIDVPPEKTPNDIREEYGYPCLDDEDLGTLEAWRVKGIIL